MGPGHTYSIQGVLYGSLNIIMIYSYTWFIYLLSLFHWGTINTYIYSTLICPVALSSLPHNIILELLFQFDLSPFIFILCCCYFIIRHHNALSGSAQAQTTPLTLPISNMAVHKAQCSGVDMRSGVITFTRLFSWRWCALQHVGGSNPLSKRNTTMRTPQNAVQCAF